MVELIRISCIIALYILGICKCNECNKLKEKLSIKESENLSLKRVMYENDLIPGEYVR